MVSPGEQIGGAHRRHRQTTGSTPAMVGGRPKAWHPRGSPIAGRRLDIQRRHQRCEVVVSHPGRRVLDRSGRKIAEIPFLLPIRSY